MKRSILRWITLVTVFAMLLPAGGLAAGQGPVDALAAGRPSAGLSSRDQQRRLVLANDLR